MKKSIKKLELKKDALTKFEAKNVVGGVKQFTNGIYSCAIRCYIPGTNVC